VPRLPPQTASVSAAATGRCIIFTGSIRIVPSSSLQDDPWKRDVGISVGERHVDVQRLVGHFAPAFSRMTTIS